MAFFFDHVPKEIRPGNPTRPFWNSWQYDISLYGFCCTSEEYDHEQCWGWTILRTSYDDDEKFRQAVSAIRQLALVRLEDEYRESRTRGQPDNDNLDDVDRKVGEMSDEATRQRLQRSWRAMAGPSGDAMPQREPATPDWLITHEMVRRYHIPIVQDKEALQGVDASEAWQHAQTLSLGEMEIGPRGQFFIYLDKESIDLLAQAPSPDALASMAPHGRSKSAWEFWVKVIQVECGVDEEGEDTDQMSEDPLTRRRIRLYDFFETFMHLCAGDLSEMSVEGNGRERFISNGEREWEFCSIHWGNTIRESWLNELYGDRLPPKWASNPTHSGVK